MSDPSAEPNTDPIIILVEPQLADNIGATARAMRNCGLHELRLVEPRDGWPNSRAHAMASGADDILENAQLYSTVEEAVADLHRLYATTARHRDMIKHEVTPRRLATELRQHAATAARCGVLFGRERIGLTNEEVTLADAIVTVPLNPEFSSLNLAQAVLLIAYEWFEAGDESPERILVEGDSRPATRRELDIYFQHLDKALDEKGFFRVPHMRAVLWRKIRNFYLRADLTEQDIRICHGMVSALEGKKRPLTSTSTSDD